MSGILVYQLEARPGDVLYVRGSVDGAETEAFGWLSATTHFYDPADVGTDGQPRKGAKTRPMTAAEVQAYVEGLLAPPPAPATVALPQQLAAVALAPEPDPIADAVPPAGP